jgi:type I restriction enzyme S subunit
MKKYPNYETTETDWLSAIPDHWDFVKAKRLFHPVTRKGYPEEKLLSVTQDKGVVPREDLEDRVMMPLGEVDNYNLVEPGNFVISLRSFEGGIEISNHRGLVSPAYTVLETGELVYGPYYKHLFKSRRFVDALHAISTGIRQGKTINYRDFGELYIPVPPLSEQRAIANYLDEKTADIDAYIAKKRELVDLLETQRRAVVNRAVTKGLDDDVDMRDSGVEWLGEIPAHWKQVRLKYLAESIIDAEHKTAPAHSDGDYLVVRTSNIRDGKLVLDDVYYTNEDGFREWTQRGVPQPGDILFTREAPAGEACLVPEDIPLCLGQRVVCIKVDEGRLLPSFAMRVLNSSLTDEFIRVTSRGATVDHFNMSDIGKIPFLVPPLDEQKRIVEHIDAQTADIDAAIERTERQIDLMQQYRTSLVTEVVTGAADVRAEVPAA